MVVEIERVLSLINLVLPSLIIHSYDFFFYYYFSSILATILDISSTIFSFFILDWLRSISWFNLQTSSLYFHFFYSFYFFSHSCSFLSITLSIPKGSVQQCKPFTTRFQLSLFQNRSRRQVLGESHWWKCSQGRWLSESSLGRLE